MFRFPTIIKWLTSEFKTQTYQLEQRVVLQNAENIVNCATTCDEILRVAYGG
jgi:hypothetical protein